MRLSPLLFLTGASLVSAQWGDYLNRILNPQKPFGAVEEVDQRAIIEKRVRTITSENWRSAINNTAATEDESVTDVAEEWLFYFTTSNANGTRNTTFWDGVFNETTVLLATSKSLPKINLGKINCASPESTKLCDTFFLTSQAKLPDFYHVASYANGTVDLREVPWAAGNITAAYLTNFHGQGLWKDVNAWTGVFNPMGGLLKEATPYVGMLLRYYEMFPPYVGMIVVSILARKVMYE
ncbi:hypothetical protein Q9L58_000039 [Maublancomyces gigas]|uniref:Uncharacterized protein n=1 Tax=Discina gigas TaxID=1032678 RepID=A0ABR3GXY4_9PEZI